MIVSELMYEAPELALNYADFAKFWSFSQVNGNVYHSFPQNRLRFSRVSSGYRYFLSKQRCIQVYPLCQVNTLKMKLLQALRSANPLTR